MNKLILISTLLLFSKVNLHAQNVVGYLITSEDERIDFYHQSGEHGWAGNSQMESDVALSAEFVWYYNQEGKLKSYKQKKIKEFKSGDRKYLKLPVTRTGFKRLVEVIYEDNKYILTTYFSLYNYMYIFRKSDMKAIVRKERHSHRKKADLKLLEKKIKPYFKRCRDLIRKIEDGIKTADYKRSNDGMFYKVQEVDCG